MNHLIVRLASLQKYSVIEDARGKLRNSIKAQINNKDTNYQWCTGDIVYRGTKEDCLRISAKEFRGLNCIETEDEEYRPEDITSLYPSQLNDPRVASEMNKLKIASPSTTKRLKANKITASPLKTNNKKALVSSSQSIKSITDNQQSNDTVISKTTMKKKPFIEETSSTVSTKQLQQEITNNQFNIVEDANDDSDYEVIERMDTLTSDLNSNPSCAELLLKELNTIKHMQTKLKNAMNEQIELLNKHSEVSSNQFNIINQIKTAIDSKSNLNQPNTTTREVLFQGKNLVTKPSVKKNKFITTTMATLFTPQELKEGYVIEGSSTSSYKALDLKRIQLLKQAFFVKFKIEPQNEDTEWNEMLLVAKRKCNDSRKIKFSNANASAGSNGSENDSDNENI